MAIGIVILLTQAGFVNLVWPFVWPILLILMGLFMILISQRKLTEAKMKKKAEKHESKLEDKLNKEHSKVITELEKTVEEKEYETMKAQEELQTVQSDKSE